MTQTQTFEWALVDESGIVDRFASESDAQAALDEGGYPSGVTVAHSPEPKWHQCVCYLDCRDCSQSGEDWHVHNDERCPVHPHALVVG